MIPVLGKLKLGKKLNKLLHRKSQALPGVTSGTQIGEERLLAAEEILRELKKQLRGKRKLRSELKEMRRELEKDAQIAYTEEQPSEDQLRQLYESDEDVTSVANCGELHELNSSR